VHKTNDKIQFCHHNVDTNNTHLNNLLILSFFVFVVSPFSNVENELIGFHQVSRRKKVYSHTLSHTHIYTHTRTYLHVWRGGGSIRGTTIWYTLNIQTKVFLYFNNVKEDYIYNKNWTPCCVKKQTLYVFEQNIT